MDEKNSVLVGVDGTDASYKATWWAANYAKHANLELQIVCAYSLPSYAAVSFDATYTALGDDVVAHTDAQEILSKAKAIAHEQGVEATTLIVTGDPSSVFVELSRNYKLIVIGNRSKGGMAERLLGTTSSSLPAYAYCPIVVVPLHNEEHEILHLNNTIQKVIVGSDETRWGLKALQMGAELADSWGADLEVLSAAPISSSQAFLGIQLKHDEQEQIIEAYADDLDGRVAPIAKMYPNLKITKKVVPGSAVDALLKESSQDDVIVVGSRGRGGFTGLILGSTSQGLIQHATSPVYVVPRKFVEASELDAKKALEAQNIEAQSIEEISGVQEVKVPEVGQEVAEAIESKIDPEHE
jgi:nucleotide-binding universal stress UspA family protein